jgi:nucleoside-diphosphate-sugar epimerase
MKQTILGAGGAIGKELAKALTAYTDDIRLVNRHPRRVNEKDELLLADLTKSGEVKKAVEGSAVVYLTAGLPYNTKIWQRDWPVIMQNVIDACLHHHCKLVFFDNIYLYEGEQLDPITEGLPVNPPSEKGKVRAAIVKMLWDAVKVKGLEALIARSADFYGPSVEKVSLLAETVIKPLSKGQKANWLANDNCRHSFTFTVDAGKATALLGNTPDAYGETWHLPTASNPPTGKEWVEAIASELGVKPRYRVVSRFMVKTMGLLMPIMRETTEMLYQYDRDYVFNSDKFEKRFGIKPTPYREGIREVVKK